MIPADSPGPVQFEGELVAVIGKKARNLSEKDALVEIVQKDMGVLSNPVTRQKP